MANQYLVDIHEFIRLKIDTAEKAKQTALQGGSDDRIRFFEGQLAELGELRRFLKQNFDLNTQRYF